MYELFNKSMEVIVNYQDLFDSNYVLLNLILFCKSPIKHPQAWKAVNVSQNSTR